MSTGSASDAEDLPEGLEGGRGDAGLKLARCSPPPGPLPPAPPAPPRRGRPAEGPGEGGALVAAPKGKRKKAAGAAAGGKRSPPGGVGGALGAEGKQGQRNAANARERARMRVLSKAFSRLKTTLPWVPPDTKLSKLDTLRLASSYIAHLRQILASDKYENGYIHPVNLTWPFMVAGKPENELKETGSTTRLCGPTAS